MEVSKIGKSLSESVTLKLNATAARMKQAGEPVIHLGGGEPKSQAPESTIEDVNKILRTREVRYSPAPGTPAMRDAAIKYTKDFYGIDVKRENVVVSSGAKQALSAAVQAIVNPGDEVIFPVPYWVSYPDIALIPGGVPVPVAASDGSFNPSIEDMKNAVTDKTKVIILNSPNNPSGAVYTEDFIAGMVKFTEENDIYLIMDDIYHRLIFDGYEPISSYKFATRSLEESNIIVINGVSKQYAMTGFRIGWCIANPTVANTIKNIQAHLTSGPNILMQEASIGAIYGDQSGVTDLAATLEKNRDILVEELEKIPGVKLQKPHGTFYSFVDFREYEKDSLKLAEKLLEEIKVVAVPGVAFGLDGFLRISYCGSEEEIREGIGRIREYLAK
jgi:aspartate aminotransferase